MRHYLAILITTALACSAKAASPLYSVSSKAQGAPFDLVVTEIKREPKKSYLSVPGFHNRTAPGARWLMCAYTDLAVKRGFSHWFVSYPPDNSEVLVVGLTNSPSASAEEVLGKDYSAEYTLGNEPMPVEKLFPMCGMRPKHEAQISTTDAHAAKAPLNAFNEVVMCRGMHVVVERQGEMLEINAQDDVRRRYAAGGVDVSFKLEPREERWYGSLGLYRASGDRDVHAVLEEGHQYFASEQEALEWLNWQDDRLHYVYNSSGLVIGWSLQRNPGESGPPHALSMQLWQFYINGKKPVSLANAKDDALRISYKNGRCERAAPSNYVASRPQRLGGREYSGKAADILKERAIDPRQVEQAIREGEHYEQNGLKGYLYGLSNGGLLWVLLDTSGRVVLLG